MDYVLAKLDWMRSERIWPNGLRYLWTDAFGVVLYLSLYRQTGEERWLDAAEELVGEVGRVLGRPRGYRIGEASDRDGQYFHYLAMWLFALARLGDVKPEYRAKGIAVAKAIHPAFVLPGRGVIWKMQEDLSAPYPGYGLGAMDAFDGYVSYSLLDRNALAAEIAEMRTLIERQYRTLDIDQDLGLGMMLWLCHFFPTEDWARVQTERSLAALDRLWIDPPGY
ncbi:glycoside hydrolase family 76 protein [Rhizobium sp. SRDI969]|uniref:glycoside hydrolase family 76 protein n=2 Tax=unclassified Rhizobium TaxID=2613769 RepID=UPI0021A35D13|nr:glycoside hydrolase family 76 protein [Rhizobium leguminosarum]UWM85714.1 glycoside hydrolase family 76 protein [Rhizobium leguminosarum bv. viciae]